MENPDSKELMLDCIEELLTDIKRSFDVASVQQDRGTRIYLTNMLASMNRTLLEVKQRVQYPLSEDLLLASIRMDPILNHRA